MLTEEFKKMVLPYHKDMYRVAYSILGGCDAAGDAVQDAMLNLWSSRNKLRNVADIKSYCLSAVRNTCIKALRRNKNMTFEPDTPEITSDEDIHNSVELKDSMELIDAAIRRLPVDQRYVLRLSAYGGFSNEEIADLLGISNGNVRILLCRARKRLKDILGYE